MKKFKAKMALLVAVSLPGLALNSCWSAMLTEMRDGALTGLGNYTQDTTYNWLDDLRADE